MTTNNIYTTDIKPFPSYRSTVYRSPDAYRIEMRHAVGTGYLQRHVWIWSDGDIEIDEWIPSPHKSIPPHFSEVAA